MPQFLYVIEPARRGFLAAPNAGEAEAVELHFQYLRTLTERGIVLLAGRTEGETDDTFGIVLFVAGSEREAQSTMLRDPAVEAGVFRARLYPFRAALGSLAVQDLRPRD
ncbi:MAG: YciI family protein [Candidatus Bipolaricaulota bacterium]